MSRTTLTNYRMTFLLGINKRKLGVVQIAMLFGLMVQAQDIPKAPDPPRLVTDYAMLLSESEIARLEQKLTAFDDSTSTQIAVVTGQAAVVMIQHRRRWSAQ